MASLAEVQKRVVDLIDSAEPKENLKKFVHGYIPKNYKRLSCSMEEAIELAIMGATHSLTYFDNKLYFTQAVLKGACISGRYKHVLAVTTSQYGKSFTCGDIALSWANEGEQVYVAGADASVSEIVMEKVVDQIQSAHSDLKSKILESEDKIEKLQTGASKKKIALKGGGVVQGITLGEAFKSGKSKNKAIGRGGDFIIDEASMISDRTYSELGRSEFARDDEKQYTRLEISNPHNPGRFMDALTKNVVPDGTLIVWMDVRTALEEGRVKSKEQVLDSTFFAHKSTCTRYLLCELEDYSVSSLFGTPKINDDKLQPDCEYYLGVDSAYKGKDGIEAFLTAVDSNGKIRMVDHVTIEKGSEWIDGVTSVNIINQIIRIINAYGVKMVCVDIGFGIWMVEGLNQRARNFKVEGINFGAGTTKFRKEANHFSAVWADNKRAEMHLDLQDLMDNEKITFTSETSELLKEQMGYVKAIRKTNGKTAIMPKDEIKTFLGKSPDELDSALLAVHACLLYNMTNGVTIHS
jgi:hypothetical protein